MTAFLPEWITKTKKQKKRWKWRRGKKFGGSEGDCTTGEISFFFYLCGVIGDYCCGQGVFSSIVFFSEGV